MLVIAALGVAFIAPEGKPLAPREQNHLDAVRGFAVRRINSIRPTATSRNLEC
jgi:hypothetical protein